MFFPNSNTFLQTSYRLLISCALFFSLWSVLFYCVLFFSTVSYSFLLCPILLYCVLFFSPFFCSSHLYCMLLYCVLFISPLFYYYLMCSALLYCFLFFFTCSILLYCVLFFFTRPILLSTVYYSSLICLACLPLGVLFLLLLFFCNHLVCPIVLYFALHLFTKCANFPFLAIFCAHPCSFSFVIFSARFTLQLIPPPPNPQVWNSLCVEAIVERPH